MDEEIVNNGEMACVLKEVKRPLICLPILAKESGELLEQTAEAAAYCPDLIEWRADGMDWSCGAEEIQGLLSKIKGAAGDIPIVFTLRKKGEGGLCFLPEGLRLDMMAQAIKTGLLNFLDAELSTDPVAIENLKMLAGQNGTRLIISYHNFDGTPDEDYLTGIIKKAVQLGADNVKLAVAARNRGDVLRLLGVVHRVKNKGLETPVSVMAMGALGAFTRIAAGFFGSEIVYASGRTATAPGQVPVEDLRRMWRILYQNCDGRDLDDYSDEYPCHKERP